MSKRSAATESYTPGKTFKQRRGETLGDLSIYQDRSSHESNDYTDAVTAYRDGAYTEQCGGGRRIVRKSPPE